MKIENLADWLAFVETVAGEAEAKLREQGIKDEDALSFARLYAATGEPATHLEHMVGAFDHDLIESAAKVLVVCDSIRELGARFSEDPEAIAGKLAARSWTLHMALAPLYRDKLEPLYFTLGQSKRGAAGAAVRWQGTETLAEIVKTIAKQRDELGEYIDPIDLWPELYAGLDAAGLEPKEREAPKRYVYGSGKVIKYEAFRKQVQRYR